MTKYLVVPAFIAMILSITSCERFVEVILDDDTVCGEDVNTPYQSVSDKAYDMLPPLTENTRFVYVNAAGEEMKLTLREKREQKSELRYKVLCYNASYNHTQYEYCEGEMVDYIFENAEQGAQIWYSWYVDHAGEVLYDAFGTSVYMGIKTGGHNTWVADDRGNELPIIPGVGEWAHSIGDTTLQGRTFHNVTYCQWGVNEGKGFYFVKGTGVVALESDHQITWVLDRVE